MYYSEISTLEIKTLNLISISSLEFLTSPLMRLGQAMTLSDLREYL
jgi:hypothetical protein